MGNSLAPQIENAQKTGVCSLSGKGLKELPPEFSKLSKVLRTTDLSNNRLVDLPSIIGQFTNLKSLTVNNNRLEHFPEHLGNLMKLETLSLQENRITVIPDNVVRKLKNLTSISLSGNKLKVFPIEICQLAKLDAVDLSSNLIEIIPDSVDSLKAIELNLNRNRLSGLPGSLTKCEKLKVLRVEENCLRVDAITQDLLRNSQICVLAVDGNLFQMRELRDQDGYDEVSSSYNNLSTLSTIITSQG
eukprot:gene17388-19128_t